MCFEIEASGSRIEGPPTVTYRSMFSVVTVIHVGRNGHVFNHSSALFVFLPCLARHVSRVPLCTDNVDDVLELKSVVTSLL